MRLSCTFYSIKRLQSAIAFDNFRWSIAFILICFTGSSFAQTQYVFTRYTQDDGLTSNKIQFITEDNRGYIWLASKEGLTRFDAYTFNTYLNDATDTNSLPDNSILGIEFDAVGNMLVQTKTALSRYDARNDHFVKQLHLSDSTTVLRMHTGTGNHVWICTPRQLLQLNIITGKYTAFEFPKRFVIESNNNVKLSLKDNELWIVSDDQIFLFEVQQKRFHELHLFDHSNQEYPPASNNRKEIIHANDKTYLICKLGLFVYSQAERNFLQVGNSKNSNLDFPGVETVLFQDNNSVIFSTGQHELIKYYFADGKNEKIVLRTTEGKSISSRFSVINAVKDDDGSIWLSSDGDGLFLFDPKKNTATQFTYQPKDANSISSNSVVNIFRDRSGVFWLACRGQGLVKMEKLEQEFHPFSVNRKNYSNTPSDDQNVRTICQSDRNQFLIGTFGGLFSFSNTDSTISEPSWWPYNNKPGIHSIGALFNDDRERIWIGRWGLNAINVFDSQKEKMWSLQIKNRDSSLPCKTIRTIIQDNDKTIWLGTVCGLFKVQEKAVDDASIDAPFVIQEFESTDPDYIRKSVVYALLPDNKKRLWIGTENGLNVLNQSDGEIIKYVHSKVDPKSIPVNNVRCLLQDRNGIIWVGTNGGGLSSFDEAIQQFTAYTVKDGLPNDNVYAIEEDADGYLWLATNKGLCRFDPKNISFVNFKLSDGLQNLEFNTNASYKTAEGDLFFGGVKGFNYFNPNSISTRETKQAVTITSVKVFDQNIPFDTTQITLAHNKNYLSFEFAAQNHYRTQDNRYSYMLEGEDKDWIFAGNRRYASYTNLSPGNYIFHVRISGGNGKGIVTSLPIVIRKPWYQTTIALLLFATALIAIIILIFRFQHGLVVRRERAASRIREAELKTEVLEEKNQSALRELEKAKELEQAYNQLQAAQEQLVQQEKLASLGQLTAGIAHEIKNPLNFVSNFSETSADILDELIAATTDEERVKLSDELKQNLEKIRKHSKRADSIIKNMLQHSRVGTGEKTMTDLNAICDEFLDLAYHGMRATHREFNCKLEKNLLAGLPKLNIVAQDISRVILNLYNNAFQAVYEKEKMENTAQSLRTKSETTYQPTVSATTEVQDHFVVLRVRDNGSGIPEGIRQKIFEPFFTTKPTGMGTGLGLSLSYDIVKAHGGWIKVESKVNEFTEFIVAIPI